MALYGKIKAKLIGKPFCTMVVLAAGSSKRMGRDKLMMEVGGVPVLVRSLQAMQDCAAVDELIVVTRTSRLEEIAALRDRYGLTKMTKVVVGGMTRAESSLAGVLAASSKATLIGIHDAARPLVTDAIITETIQAAKKSRAAWLREMKSELKKVTWPTKKTVLKNTGTVLLCSLAIGVCIWIFDFVMVTAVQMILSLFA
mgnify:CR=1 FL=1